MDYQDVIEAAEDAGEVLPERLPPLMTKIDAKDLLEEIEVEIKERKRWRDADH